MDDDQKISEEGEPDLWHDDILERRGFADFLSKTLAEQTRSVSERHQRGLTVALDAEWGAGKTFFVEHWAADLRRQGFPVVMFDAWKHDLGEAPAVVLMAAIDEALRKWFKQMSIEAATAEKAKALSRSGIRQLRRAVLPAGGVILSGMLKKVSGIAWKDLKGAYVNVGDDDDDDAPDHVDAAEDSVTDDASKEQENIDAGLDRIFEKVLGEQSQRIEAIERFRTEMGKTIDLIQSEAGAKIPVFVFVDELDRCRPSYAISLLEEIKHIFGLSKVCFVVSTNVAQLSHSVRAVYGQGFDAEHYLKRFFDQAYAIPAPDYRRHVALLLKEHPALSSRSHDCGLPLSRKDNPTAVDTIEILFNAFGLDLRSQKQVFRIAETAASAIDPVKPLYVMWLFFLAILIHKNQQYYSHLMRKDENRMPIKEIIASVIVQEKRLVHPLKNENGWTNLSTVLAKYNEWSLMDASQIFQLYNQTESAYFPGKNIDSIASELPSNFYTDSPPIPSIRHYVDFVKYAGYRRELSE